MAKTKYLYSTLSTAVAVTLYAKHAGQDILQVADQVVIQGGANIPDKYLRTPRGVVTPITEDQYELIKEDKVFQSWVKNGFITVRDKKVDEEVAVTSDMEGQDNSAPLSPEQLAAEGIEAPTSGDPANPTTKNDAPAVPPAPKSSGRRA